ncbi:MAG: protein kinase [Myxococcales bacterium]
MTAELSDAGQLCVSCGARNTTDARFCNQCGLSLGHSFNATTLTISSPPASLPMSTRSLGVASTRPPPAPLSIRSGGVSALHELSTDARELADPLIGVVIAERYRIKERIGRGGMGVVYRVEHARIGKLMALKLLTGELTRDPQQVARFKREAQLVSRLSHPNTVQVFDFGASDGLVYLAMEYLKGEDLGHLIRRLGPLSAERTLKVVIQICSSLSEAHAMGMVHRDLKPENIIVVHGGDEEDLVKVLDFGLAKLREGGELSDVTSSGAIVGTPYYMSPEQIRGDDVGPESDVYALGALTYACLTGSVVFDAQTPMGVLTKHLTELPESPSRRFPELKIPPSLSQIVMATLEKDPKRRMRSVGELQQALISELEHGGKPADVERLLDTSHLRDAANAADADGGAATRDEVERYERKLRQRGRAIWAILAALLVAASVAGFRAFQRWTAPPVFAGDELEPNDSASEATVVPFPFAAKGIIGKRLDKERSDRDFYRFRVPSNARAVWLGTVEHKLEIKRENGTIEVRFPEHGKAGVRHLYSDWMPGDPIWTGTINSHPVAVQVRPIPNGFALAYRGVETKAFVYTAREAAYARLMPAKKAADTGKQVLCPMPGLVVSIAVKEGEEVKAGDTVAVVEAMKMENVLRAEIDGTVKKINAKQGDSLAVDAVILEFA